MPAPDVGDDPLPEGERLRVRVVDAEDPHAVADPVLEDVAARRPQRHAVGVLRRARSRSGRCPGTSWAGSRRSGSSRRAGAGTTRGARAPRGGRASTAGRSRGRPPCPSDSASSRKATKSSSVPSSGCDGVVAALGGADRPRAARGRRRRRRERVVPALAVRAADRVDRRQVDDVEAHLGDGRRAASSAPAKPPSLRGNSSYHARARPRSRSTQRPGVRQPREVDVGRGRAATMSARWSSRPASSFVRTLQVSAAASTRRRASRSRSRFGACGARASRRSAPTSSSISRSGSSTAAALVGVVAPGAEAVGPRLDDEVVVADDLGLEASLPAVVDDLEKGSVTPRALRWTAPPQPGAEVDRGRRGGCRR